MRRAWFRFSLSTCLILVFAAGTLIGANMIDRAAPVVIGYGVKKGGERINFYGKGLGQGWPFIIISWHGIPDDTPFVEYSYAGLAANIAIGAVGLFALGRLIEWSKASHYHKLSERQQA